MLPTTLPYLINISTCRNFEKISSGFGRLFAMWFLRFHNHNGGPLQRGRITVVFLWSALILLFVRNYGEQIGMSLSPDESVLHLVGPMFLAMVFIQFADGLQSISLGALRGLSDNLIPNLTTVSIYWGGALPIAYVCGVTLGFGAFGVLVGYGVGVIITTLVLQYRLVLIARRIRDEVDRRVF